MAQLFLDADLLALPYLEASQSGVAALAIGSGLPVIATQVGELGRLVGATGVGRPVQPDASTVAEAIIAFLSDPKQRATCRANAHQATRGMLSPDRIACKTLAAYLAAGKHIASSFREQDPEGVSTGNSIAARKPDPIQIS